MTAGVAGDAKEFRFDLCKFTGDGWILLFPDTISGVALMQFAYSLCEMINAELD